MKVWICCDVVEDGYASDDYQSDIIVNVYDSERKADEWLDNRYIEHRESQRLFKAWSSSYPKDGVQGKAYNELEEYRKKHEIPYGLRNMFHKEYNVN